jgi:glycosyltransferase involved in cell wall biosynthesis
MGEPLVEVMMRYFYKDEDLMVSEMSRAIKSLNEQTYKELLVTFCRDGGIDASDLIKHNCKTEWRSIGGSQNMGRGFATNCLLTVCVGDYFALLDSDDYMEPHFIEGCVDKALSYGLTIIKPQVKLVYFRCLREDVQLSELFFERLLKEGDDFYRTMFGNDSIKVFAESLQMISKMFHRCMAALRTRSDMNITEDCYWMYKANRIVKQLGLKSLSFLPQAKGFYIQVHPMNRMQRYEELGLKMKAEDHYELPTEEDIREVENAVAKGL